MNRGHSSLVDVIANVIGVLLGVQLKRMYNAFLIRNKRIVCDAFEERVDCSNLSLAETLCTVIPARVGTHSCQTVIFTLKILCVCERKSGEIENVSENHQFQIADRFRHNGVTDRGGSC